MAYISMTYIVMAYIVMAYIAKRVCGSCRLLPTLYVRVRARARGFERVTITQPADVDAPRIECVSVFFHVDILQAAPNLQRHR